MVHAGFGKWAPPSARSQAQRTSWDDDDINIASLRASRGLNQRGAGQQQQQGLVDDYSYDPRAMVMEVWLGGGGIATRCVFG